METKRILVPVDFSDMSINALNYAAEIGKKIGAEIIVFHVMDTYQYNAQLGRVFDYTYELTKEMQQKLEEIRAERSNWWGVKMTSMLTSGKTYQEIINVAKEKSVNLVVMGTTGVSGISDFERYVMGSNALRVVRNATCPVLTIRAPREKVTFDNILLPLDLTKRTTQKVNMGIFFAQLFGSKLHILSITETLDSMRGKGKKAKKQLEKVESRLKEANVDYSTIIESEGDVADTVLAFSEAMDVDMVIIMTHREKHWNKTLLGSDARKVIHRSTAPVLSIRPKEENQ